MKSLFLSIILPLFVSIAANSLWLTTETAFLSRFNPTCISFISYLGPWFFLTMALFESIGTPLTILSARYYRSSDVSLDKLKSTAVCMLKIAIIATVLMGFIYIFFIVHLNDHTEFFSKNFRIFSLFMALSLFPWAFRLYFSGLCAGYKKTFVGALSSCTFIALKIIFSYLFMRFFKMDTCFPIGLATFFAMTISALVPYFLSKKILPSSSIVSTTFDWTIFNNIFFIGLPLFLIYLLSAADSYFFMSIFGKYGDQILANLTILERVRRLYLLPIISISIGLGIYISSELSIYNRKEIFKSVMKVTTTVFILYVLCIPFFSFLSPYIIKYFTGEDPRFYPIALTILSYEIWVYPVLAMGLLSEGIFEGMAITYPNLIVFAIVILFGRILPTTWIFRENPVFSLQYIYAISHSLHFLGFLWSIWFLLRKDINIQKHFSITEYFKDLFGFLKQQKRKEI